jgi:UDP-3-O-[3-hydroxymyristoyl] glucosamine N-acyltransferase
VGKSKKRCGNSNRKVGIILGGICLDDYDKIPEPYKNYLKIGKNCYIKSGTILCGEGFHFRRNPETQTLKFTPHTKGVILRDNVWVGSNCTIDRGRWRPTVIGGGTKIDNNVQISHNVRIGKNCIIGTHAVILGSAEIGDGSEIWTRATIHQGVKVGKNCAVGAHTYLRHDLPDNMVAYQDNKTGKLTIKPISETKKYDHRKEYKKIGGGVSTKCLNGKCSAGNMW